MGTGTIPVMDIENQHQRWLNAGNSQYRKQLKSSFSEIETRLKTFSRRNNIDFLSINTREDYIPELESFFRARRRKRSRRK